MTKLLYIAFRDLIRAELNELKRYGLELENYLKKSVKGLMLQEAMEQAIEKAFSDPGAQVDEGSRASPQQEEWLADEYADDYHRLSATFPSILRCSLFLMLCAA